MLTLREEGQKHWWVEGHGSPDTFKGKKMKACFKEQMEGAMAIPLEQAWKFWENRDHRPTPSTTSLFKTPLHILVPPSW
jgi:hypothetical protein